MIPLKKIDGAAWVFYAILIVAMIMVVTALNSIYFS